MQRTIRKLQEAQFFLGRLAQTRGTEEFAFYLSAFVSAARSITWVFRAECKDLPGWSDWYDQKRPSPDEQHLMKQFNAVRVRSVKVDPLEVGLTVEVRIPPGALTAAARAAFTSNEGNHERCFVSRREDGKVLVSVSGVEAIGDVYELLLTVGEFPGSDIQRICECYLALLSGVVNEWRDLSAA